MIDNKKNRICMACYKEFFDPMAKRDFCISCDRDSWDNPHERNIR